MQGQNPTSFCMSAVLDLVKSGPWAVRLLHHHILTAMIHIGNKIEEDFTDDVLALHPEYSDEEGENKCVRGNSGGNAQGGVSKLSE